MIKIAVIDDEQTTRAGLIRLIKKIKPSYECVGEAANGLDGLRLVRETHPDIVITDIKMPGMDGWEAARRIRASARPDAQRIALVALSANAFAEDARRSRAVGMDGHIGKPVDFDELEALFGRIRSGRCKGKDNA